VPDAIVRTHRIVAKSVRIFTWFVRDIQMLPSWCKDDRQRAVLVLNQTQHFLRFYLYSHLHFRFCNSVRLVFDQVLMGVVL
jgi:hypothetical protein